MHEIHVASRHGCIERGEVRKGGGAPHRDLGTEAIRRIEVEEFPVIVVNDGHGGDLYLEGTTQHAR